MEIKILEDEKERLVFEVVGPSNTFCNALRAELWNDKHTKAAAYNYIHPALKKSQFVIETDGADPRKIVLAAVNRLDKVADDFSTLAKGIK